MKKIVAVVVFCSVLFPASLLAGYTVTNGDANLTVAADLITGWEYSKTKVVDTSQRATTGFQLHRARVNLMGNVTKDMSYRFRFRLQPVNATTVGTAASVFNMTDYAYMSYKFIPEFALTGGKILFAQGLSAFDSTMAPLTWGTSNGTMVNAISSNGLVLSYNLGLSMTGMFLDGMLDYAFVMVNDMDSLASARSANADNRYDYQFALALNSKEKVDFLGYKVDGDFRYKVGTQFSVYNPLNGVLSRKILTPYFFMSYMNFIASADTAFEFTTDIKSKDYRFNLGYMFLGWVRPGAGLAFYKSGYVGEGATKWADLKNTTRFALNLTTFHMDGKFRPSLEWDYTTHSDNGALDPKWTNHNFALKASLDI